MNTSNLITYNIYEDAPWRNIAALEERNFFERFWFHCRRPLLVCCLTINTPELCATKARAPIGRALREVRCSLIDCGVEANFELFKLPRLDESDRKGRFRVLLFVDGNVIYSGEKLREHLTLKLEAQLPGQLFSVALNEPPDFNSDGAMRIDENNFQIAFGWFYHYLADSDYLYYGHTLSAHRKKRKFFHRYTWKNRKFRPIQKNQ